MTRYHFHRLRSACHGVLRCVVAVALAAAGLSCAGQVAPSGGPPDTTPPVIIATAPAPRALRVREARIQIEFSKYVVRHTVEESAFLSPNAGALTFEWGSTNVEIRCADTLRPNTTYILTLGTDVTDTRNNHLASAFSLPFSTGDEIDTCAVGGRVFDTDPSGILVFAYRLNGRNRDTLNPCQAKPDYLTQTGRDGSFVIPYMAFGGYRLVAVRDEYKNLLYDRQTDRFGMSAMDIVLTPESPSRGGLQFQMAGEDTSRPFLSNLKALDATHLLLRFSEAMDTTPLPVDSVSLVDTVTHTPLPVLNVSFALPLSQEAQIVTAPQQAGAVYRLTLSGCRDLADNRLLSLENRAVVGGSGDPDTTRPSCALPDIAANATEVSVDDSIVVVFSEPILTSSFDHAVMLLDTTGADLGGRVVFRNAMAAAFVPARRLAYGTSYRVKINLDSLVDFSRNHGADSSALMKFQTIDEKRLSSVRGKVVDTMPGGTGRVFLLAMDISDAQAKPRGAVMAGPGEFALEGLVEGRYVLSVFRDADGNGLFSPGLPYPYQPAERFALFPDTLKLRARWPLEGVVIRLSAN